MATEPETEPHVSIELHNEKIYMCENKSSAGFYNNHDYNSVRGIVHVNIKRKTEFETFFVELVKIVTIFSVKATDRRWASCRTRGRRTFVSVQYTSANIFAIYSTNKVMYGRVRAKGDILKEEWHSDGWWESTYRAVRIVRGVYGYV
ncbi:hypothetical protein AX774_g3954 [Zancudomyces culisetae]|uniref:Uncharacterized protein n=1 Tax=Zancudomyces culisetae TaxID=1213189 RepID=A0A1R1PNL9_ZANCU|nr:hypothetical protein AX774_g3954 [Zancudomyces culisetae]|eukprot:OMH82566.1 hypothetical protein AX774_g3954 [Zancudomyces culisetae]